jgi:hypothetical protein
MVERFFAEITRKRVRRGVFKSADPLRRWTLVILVICLVLFGWTPVARSSRLRCATTRSSEPAICYTGSIRPRSASPWSRGQA